MRNLVGKAMLVAAVAVPAAAEAQQSVVERVTESQGIRLGGFLLYPELEANVQHTDNVFADETDEEEDIFFEVAPAVDLRSDWSVHQVALYGQLISRTYDEQDEQDTLQALGGIDARIDVTRTTNIFGNVYARDGAEQLFENPLSNSTASLAEPVEFTEFGGEAGIEVGFNRLAVTLSGGGRDADYEDGRSVLGDNIDQDGRDITEITGSVRAAYETGPGTSLFTEYTYTDLDYDEDTGPGVINRDGDINEIVGGLALNVTELLRGEAAIGYFEQSFDNPALSNVDGTAVRVGVDWFVTRLLTLGADARRGVGSSAIQDASSILSSTYGVNAEFEVRRNLVIDADVQYRDDEYRAIDRTDERVSGGVGFLYQTPLGVGITGRYSAISVDSSGTVSNNDYDINTFRLGFRFAI